MKRRNFLLTLLGFPNTAGFQYYEGERLFNQLNIDDPLQLRRDPENKYDKRAVETYWNNNMPGHIPKMANMSISQILDNCGKLNAEITRLYPQQKPWYCVSLAVYINNV